MQINRYLLSLIAVLCVNTLLAGNTHSDEIKLQRNGENCGDDPLCFNRVHPDLPMTIKAEQGDFIIFETRNAQDADLTPDAKPDRRLTSVPGSTVHPVTGPVYFEGAKAGDSLAVTIEKVEPGAWGFTSILPFGFISDLFPGKPVRALWKLNKEYAETDFIPGVRIPFAGFPGIIMTLPDTKLSKEIAEREKALLNADGNVSPPEPTNAYPSELCSSLNTTHQECLRTTPPREHGGNLDIRYLGEGVTVYLPCYLDGCGLALGDAHYAQGDGEVSGTAIEMDARITVSTRVIDNSSNGQDKEHMRGIAFEGPASLMNIPSKRFYATTGIPVKQKGEIPPDMQYLESRKISELENLSKDISLAARNALIAMLNYLVEERGYSRQQAYIIMSVAVDLRIGQLVDAPNVNVSAILPLDIFYQGTSN